MFLKEGLFKWTHLNCNVIFYYFFFSFLLPSFFFFFFFYFFQRGRNDAFSLRLPLGFQVLVGCSDLKTLRSGSSVSLGLCLDFSNCFKALSHTHTHGKIKNGGVAPLWPLLEYIFNKIRFQTGGKFLVVVLQTATCAASHVIYPSIKTKCGTCSTLLEILRHLYIYSLYHIVKDSFDTWEWIPLKEESGNHVNCVIIAWDVCINCGESVLEVFAAASEGLCERRCGLFKCDNVLQVETVIFNHEEVWKEKNIKDI